MRYHETPITVRFNEVDSYHVAWHGHYVVWLEVGRNDLAGRFGLDAAQISALGYLAPVVNLELKYLRPLRFGDRALVQTSLNRTGTASLEFNSRIVSEAGETLATGRTVHVLTDLEGTLQYRLPAEIADRMERMLAWQEG